MASRPRILVTNDDGVYSPGLLAALQAVSEFADVAVVAPLTQQTAMGRAWKGRPDAQLEKVILEANGASFEAYACDASPARAVDHGLKVLSFKPDLVVSGINYGENLGANITSSGTVGAAIEAACWGIPALAVSLETPLHSHYTYTDQKWDVAAHFVRYFAQRTIEHGLPQGVDVLKIDVPSDATVSSVWRVTSLSRQLYYRSSLPNPSIGSRLEEVVVSKERGVTEPVHSDVYALAVDKVVSVTPLCLDLTAHGSFSAFEDWR